MRRQKIAALIFSILAFSLVCAQEETMSFEQAKALAKEEAKKQAKALEEEAKKEIKQQATDLKNEAKAEITQQAKNEILGATGLGGASNLGSSVGLGGGTHAKNSTNKMTEIQNQLSQPLVGEGQQLTGLLMIYPGEWLVLKRIAYDSYKPTNIEKQNEH